MDFFEKIGKTASKTYKTAAEKTNKIAGDTKLKLKISDNKSKIEDIYTEIGKKVYQKYELDGNLEIKDDISEDLNRIKQLSDEIEEYEAQRLNISDMKQCPNCKNKIEKNVKFCPICGAQQEVCETQQEGCEVQQEGCEVQQEGCEVKKEGCEVMQDEQDREEQNKEEE